MKNKQPETMSTAEKKNINDKGAGPDESVILVDKDNAVQTRKLKSNKNLILILLFIMFLVISQVLILLSSNGLNEQASTPVVNEQTESTINDVRSMNDDLKKAIYVDAEPEQVAPAVVEPKSSTEKVVNITNKTAPVIAIEKKDQYEKPVPSETKASSTDKKAAVSTKPETEVAVVKLIADTEADDVIVNENIKAIGGLSSGYIKHDKSGKPLADGSQQWSCVHDTVTGLMWEVKSDDDAMRSPQNLYSWYDPEHRELPGKPDGGRCKGGTDCDTNAYVQAMNERKYCGHDDWQLPTREQMQTLVDLKYGGDKLTINKQYFPETVPSWYWTSSDEADRENFAWYVLFRNGFALSDLKERPKHVRLVRVTEDKS